MVLRARTVELIMRLKAKTRKKTTIIVTHHNGGDDDDDDSKDDNVDEKVTVDDDGENDERRQEQLRKVMSAWQGLHPVQSSARPLRELREV